MIPRILVFSALAMLTANVANATTYFNTINSPATFSGNADGPVGDGVNIMAASFNVPGTPNFNSVTLALTADSPTDGGSTMVYLVPDDGSGGANMAGAPMLNGSGTNFANAVLVGTILDSSLDISGTGPSLVALTITPAELASVTSKTSDNEYWIGLVASGTSSVEWNLTSSIDGPGMASQWDFNNALAEFDDTSGAYQMIVSANVPAPEPATLAILGCGLAGIGYVRRRKAKKG
ncbi:PEP-CTERM sorting domain-containing protein [Acidisphaera sp. S103]|uniref:PEP-CTERM sorting domain-containing protein n=1 Tax=Acidisphaera sp. S103 TaxID=1747223 RepID=UPI00131A66D2|nr:PEP-CTERM sorting domain-containing protein [Acidisphaera sp. S103]